MAIKLGSTLKEYLEDYIKGREGANGADTYAEYKRERGYTHEEDYHRAMSEALRRAQMSAYGRQSEATRVSGLSGGYGEYLGLLNKDALERTEESLRAERDKTARTAYRGYLGYLDSYGRQQDSLKNRISEHLVSIMAYNPERIYRYAVGQGLNKEAAVATVGAVQELTRGKIKKEIIDMIQGLRITPEAAADRARQYGLPEEDINEILEYTKGYRENYTEYSKELLEKLLSMGAPTTESYKK